MSVIKDDSSVNRGGVLLIAFVWGGVLVGALKMRVVLIDKNGLTSNNNLNLAIFAKTRIEKFKR